MYVWIKQPFDIARTVQSTDEFDTARVGAVEQDVAFDGKGTQVWRKLGPGTTHLLVSREQRARLVYFIKHTIRGVGIVQSDMKPDIV